MELRHLRYFIRAAELLHFTRAAESLYISQPTLSIHIQQLEEELGAQLFARVGRNVRLTEAGELLLNRARQAVRELETAGEEIDAVKGVVRGNLSVAALPLHGSTLFPQWMFAFSARHPEVRIRARSGATEDIEAGIIAGTVDLGYSILPPEHPEISSQELLQDEIVLVLAPTHPFAKLKSVSIEQLDKLPMALTSPRVASTRGLIQYFANHSVQPDIVLEYDDGHALIAIARAGKLVTCLPRLAVQDVQGVKILPLPAEGQKIKTGAMWTHLSPAARAFLDVLVEFHSREIVRPALDGDG